MGTILGGKCPGCGYDISANIGGGLRDCRPDTALLVSGNDTGLAEALKRGAGFRIDRRLAYCKKCKNVTACTQVFYCEPDSVEQMVSSTCKECGNELSLYSQNVKAIVCPKCGNIFSLQIIGHWD